jgi:WD40 repeat protein
MRTLPQSSPVRSLTFLPGGPLLAFTRGYSVSAWDYAKEGRGSVRRGLASHGYQVKFVGGPPSGDFLVTVGGDRTVRVWGASGETPLDQWDLPDTVQAAALSGDGRRLAVATGQVANSYLKAAALVTAFDVERGALVAQLRLDHAVARSLAYADDGGRLAVGINRVHALLWEPGPDASATSPRKDSYNPFRGWSRRGGLPQRDPLIYGGGTIPRALAFSPDGRLLATGAGARIVVWDLESNRRIRTITGHDKPISSLGFAPNSAILSSTSQDGTLRFWDPATGAERARHDLGLGKLTSAAFSPDVTLAAAGGERGVALVELDERLLGM